MLVVRQGGGGRGGKGAGQRGERYSGVAVSRDVVVQGAVSSATVLWVPDARVSAQGASLPALSATRSLISKVTRAAAAALWGAGV